MSNARKEYLVAVDETSDEGGGGHFDLTYEYEIIARQKSRASNEQYDVRGPILAHRVARRIYYGQQERDALLANIEAQEL